LGHDSAKYDQFEQTLRESPDILAAIIGSAMDAIIAVDDAQRIALFNAAAEGMFACPANDAIGSSIERFIPQRFRTEHGTHVRRFAKSGVTNRAMGALGTLWGLRATGEEFPIEASISKLECDGKKFFTVVIRDITERQRAEEAFESSERRNRELVLRSPIPMVVSRGPRYECELVNLKFTELFGYTIEDVPDEGHWWPLAYPDEVYREQIKAEWREHIQEAASGHQGQIDPMEAIVQCKDGSKRNVEFHFTFMEDTYLVSFVDLTERRRAEEAIKKSEMRYRRIVETTSEGVWLLDSTFRTAYVNRQMADMLGYAPQEMVGRSVFDFYFSEDVQRKKQVLMRRRQGRPEQLEERLQRKDGSELWVRMAASPVFNDNGEFDGAFAMVCDITGRKLAEDALQESEQRFRLVANTAPVMIWMSGLDKKPTYFNQLWLDFTGLSETDLQNGLVGIVHPEDYPHCHEVYCRGFDQRQPFRKECRLRRHDGQYRWILDMGVPRFHKDGSFAGYIGSCIDVTDSKRAEEALSGMTRKLVEAQEQERARIARELHDDINQRLAMLAIELEQLKESPSEVRGRVQELLKQTVEISNDVQALSHDLHSSKLEYLGVVAGMKSWCKEFAVRQKMEIDFRSDVLRALPLEVGRSLFRVLQEALNNATKHSGVRRVEVQLVEDSDEVHLIVSDSGRGFDVEAALHGRGLGLTSMKERVRLLNGTIAIDSQPMGGTTIHVTVSFKSDHYSQRAAS
jgi:PAS domain S-box-containing protein